MSECSYWDPSGCVGSPECPPRCPRFVDKTGRALTIRDYRPEDRAALEAMYRGYGTDHRAQGLPPLTDNRVERWLDTLLDEGRNVVAVDARGGGVPQDRPGDDPSDIGSGIVGHAVYTPQDANEPELAVFVHPDHHDRGIGTECCRQVIARAAADEREAIVLSVERTNRRALAVYRHLGFEAIEGKGTEMRMRLPLSAPATEEPRLGR